MLRTSVPGLILFGSALFAGCSAGSPTPSSDDHGGSANGGATSGSTSGASNKAGGGGAPSSAGGSSGSTAIAGTGGGGAGVGAGAGAGGVSAAGTGGSLGAAGGSVTAGSGGVAGTSSATPPLFSDDFEGAAIDMTKWTLRVNSDPTSTFSLDTSQKHGGKQSLHLKQTGFSSMLAAEKGPIFPAPNNSYYARVWLRVASASGGGLPTGHVIWIETGDVTNDTHEVRVGANLGYFQSNLVPSDTDIRDPGAAMTTDAWHCIQLHYGTDLLDVTLDGVRSSISTTNWVAANSANGGTMPRTAWSPTYAAFRIGWELAGGEIWFDDVALDHVPVACN